MSDILHKIPFLRITLGFITGIMIGYYSNFQKIYFLLPVFIFLFLFVIAIKNIIKPIFQKWLGFLFTLLLLLAGTIQFINYNQLPTFNKGKYIQGILLEKPIEKPNSYKVDLMIKNIFSDDSVYKSKEKIIVYFQKTSSVNNLNPGDLILFNKNPEFIINAGNPFEFDYQKYLLIKKIYRQIYIPSGDWIKTGVYSGFSLKIYGEKIREKLLDIYRENQISGIKFEILSALTLGYKEALGDEVKNVFSSAGAMHVLAVSGLHTGIIYLIINLLLGSIKKNRTGRFSFICISIFSLWSFAIITGLSPSVQRAAIMFSFLIIGENIRRPANSYNSIAASAFILLIINPNLLFDVGFQLSYSAVIGIIFFQPKMYQLVKFNNIILNKIWSLFTVSIAAQISTFPFTSFYFNQFAAYSWLSSFVVIPAAFLFIFLGILILTTSYFHFISIFFSQIISKLLESMYLFLSQIQKFPFAVIQNINISKIELILLILIIISVMFFISYKNPRYLFGFFILLIFYASVNISNKYFHLIQNQMIIYNADNQIFIHLIKGRDNYIIYKDEDQINTNALIIEPVQINKYLKKPVFIQVNSFYEDKNIWMKNNMISFANKYILINENNQTKIDDFSYDYEIDLIHNNPSNSKKIISYQSNINDRIDYSKIHNLTESGAFIMDF